MASPKIVVAAYRNFRRVLPLLRDERVPLGLKVGTCIMGLLIVSPLDVFGDIPVLGLLDDAVLLTLLAAAFVLLAERMTQRIVTPVTPQTTVEPEPGVMQLPRAHPVRKA
ncbi:MAG TPA: DUF1232 domain-containing protein [Candidatus Baltobacteraceae bacterium]|jgi:uncharacterized membrane protein YkvA (DUF1232 family)|nr:DUF1232 domain-containing protein [Candidatus Baltobacteraceae bacterium]